MDSIKFKTMSEQNKFIKSSFIETIQHEKPGKLNELPFLVFLDIDGVLNCEVFYHTASEDEKWNNISPFRIRLLNELCEKTNAKIVISSSWRMGKSIKHFQSLFDSLGGNFEVIGKTPNLKNGEVTIPRGVEINEWIKLCIKEEYFGEIAEDFQHTLNYVILDDDSDMLLHQEKNFFHCDNYSGLTPNIIHKIKRFYKGYF
jgi:hypothetical protein